MGSLLLLSYFLRLVYLVSRCASVCILLLCVLSQWPLMMRSAVQGYNLKLQYTGTASLQYSCCSKVVLGLYYSLILSSMQSSVILKSSGHRYLQFIYECVCATVVFTGYWYHTHNVLQCSPIDPIAPYARCSEAWHILGSYVSL